MTISGTTAEYSFGGDGMTTTPFLFNAPVYDDDDLEVILITDATGAEVEQTKTTHYTVAVAGDNSTATITMVTAPAVGETLLIRRKQPNTQLTDYTTSGEFPAETHEEALDKLALQSQTQQLALDRSFRLPKGETPTEAKTRIPVVSTRASKYLGWNASGEIIAIEGEADASVSAYGATLVDDADASEALGTLGFSTYGKTLIDDADAAAGRETMGGLILEVNDLAALKALSGSDLQGIVYMRHHTTAGDGGGGMFRYVDGASAGTYTNDDGITIRPTGGDGSAAWIRQHNQAGVINVRWFGATGDGATDDYTAIAAAISAAGNSDSVYFPGGGNYRIETPLDVASEIALVGDGSTVSKIYCHGVPLCDYTTASGINSCRFVGLSLIATSSVAKIMQIDNISYTRFEDILFDGNSNATDGLIVQGTAGTIAYNDFVACDIIDCSGVGLKIGQSGQTQTWFRFDRCRFNSNGTNMTIYGKQHIFHACSIENSLENDIHSPLTTFSACWLESSELHFNTGAYGCAVNDCRSRGGTLDNTDFHLRNWILDETIKEFAFNKHSPGLMYREGNRQLKFIYGDRAISINTGLGNPYTSFLGPRKPFTIVGYGFFVHAGGTITPASTKLEVFQTLDTYKDDPLTVTASIKQFTVPSSSYSSNDTEIVTWTDDVTVYHDHNPSSALINGIAMRFTASESNNLRVFPFLIVVE